jgi:hypothetical protein
MTYDDFINRMAGLLRRDHPAMGAAFLAKLRRTWAHRLGFLEQQVVPWVLADLLEPGWPCACPWDGGPIRPTTVVVYWAGYRWRVVVGECGGCGRVWHSRLTGRADDYAGREVGRLLRRRFHCQARRQFGTS